MRVGAAEVIILGGNEMADGYVHLEHETQYTLRILNHFNRRVDAEVRIDNKDQGAYRVEAFRAIQLERPSHENGRFTFFRVGTAEAAQAGAEKIDNQDRGLVQVTFKVEKAPVVVPISRRGAGGSCAGGRPDSWAYTGGVRGQSMNCASSLTSGGVLGVAGAPAASAGITGLTGHSKQSFVEVKELDYDEAATVVVTLRLVETTNTVRELGEAHKGNPVPQPVG
jgi:hypothetical protein